MPAATAAHPLSPAGFEIDHATHTLRFTRRLAAPPTAVFAAWTDPAQISKWWDPAGVPLARCDIDLRVGGEFAFTSCTHPDMTFTGTYREIAPPGRLVFVAMGAEGRVTLAPSGAGTMMTVEIICSSAEHLEQFVQMGVAAGTSQTLDNLVAFAAGGAMAPA
ncbi:MAG: Activator of Hsp90 ATPase 1 family protein [Caulobacteraceae bacterium]|nr:Activator of Hsp90 ATPase 1 family protein [Caulobacteraceae bacterium]